MQVPGLRLNAISAEDWRRRAASKRAPCFSVFPATWVIGSFGCKAAILLLSSGTGRVPPKRAGRVPVSVLSTMTYTMTQNRTRTSRRNVHAITVIINFAAAALVVGHGFLFDVLQAICA